MSRDVNDTYHCMTCIEAHSCSSLLSQNNPVRFYVNVDEKHSIYDSIFNVPPVSLLSGAGYDIFGHERSESLTFPNALLLRRLLHFIRARSWLTEEHTVW